VEAHLPAGAYILTVVFDFSALDGQVARDAKMPRTVTSEDSVQNHYWQPRIFDALAYA
jgi:hypothetical protein